jgi:hypothetical protein
MCDTLGEHNHTGDQPSEDQTGRAHTAGWGQRTGALSTAQSNTATAHDKQLGRCHTQGASPALPSNAAQSTLPGHAQGGKHPPGLNISSAAATLVLPSGLLLLLVSSRTKLLLCAFKVAAAVLLLLIFVLHHHHYLTTTITTNVTW